jgi:hypothetical protein
VAYCVPSEQTLRAEDAHVIKKILALVALALVALALQDAGAQTPDADLAERVRRNIVADRNLSSHAAKISIVATNGEIRLSGLVQNEGEKAQIAAKAATVAGQGHVVNDLRVMTNVPDGAALRALLEQARMPRTPVAAAN